MPRYIIERQYLLPIYEHLLIEAPNLETACREALDEIAHPWNENAKEDFDSAQPTTITEAAELPGGICPQLQASDEVKHAGLAHLLYDSGLDRLTIPREFAEDSEQRRAIGFF